jgi:phospho-N-acetylmuramoyl-pentapeptide-transferase
MLYWLSAFSDTIGPLNVLRYITFRTGGAMFTALVFAFLLAPYIIAMLRARQIRMIHPAGLIMLSALVISTLLWSNPANRYVWIVLGVTLGFGLIGLRDDCLAAARQSGLSDKIRIVLAAGIAALACLALIHLDSLQSVTPLRARPFDLGWLSIPIGALIIVAAAQVVNLADRLRARIIGPLLLVALSFGFILFFAGNPVLADYFNVRYVRGIGELAVLCGAVTGAGLGFLWFNTSPVRIFIGATGSLAIGAMFGAMAVAAKYGVVLAVSVTAQG